MIVSTQLVSFGIARVVDSDASILKKVALDWAPLCTIRNLCDATRARCDAQSESLQSESLESARDKKLIRFGAFRLQLVAASRVMEVMQGMGVMKVMMLVILV